jgi:hypothetical protein
MSLKELLQQQRDDPAVQGADIVPPRQYLIRVHPRAGSASPTRATAPVDHKSKAAPSSSIATVDPAAAAGAVATQGGEEGGMVGYGYLAHPTTNDYLKINDVLHLTLQLLRTNQSQGFDLTDDQRNTIREIGSFAQQQAPPRK